MRTLSIHPEQPYLPEFLLTFSPQLERMSLGDAVAKCLGLRYELPSDNSHPWGAWCNVLGGLWRDTAETSHVPINPYS